MESTTGKVRSEELLDLEQYEQARARIRERVMGVKSRRRVHLGEHLTFLFENTETIRYQVQEMLRAEQRTSQADIEHELATYNELLGDPGGLGCTLLIELEDPAERDVRLREWLDLPRHLYLELEDVTRTPARYDVRQVGENRLSSVQYLKFDCGGVPPVAVGSDLPGLGLRATLTPVQAKALAEDLGAQG